MIPLTAAILLVGVIVYTLSVRAKDLPGPDPVSPTKHLEDRRAQIYENLRDLQFEYRLGKLSDADYQQTKQDLQKELARVLSDLEGAAPKPPATAAAKAATAPAAKAATAPAPAPPSLSNNCPHCGASFPKPMKFCGECGKSMLVEAK